MQKRLPKNSIAQFERKDKKEEKNHVKYDFEQQLNYKKMTNFYIKSVIWQRHVILCKCMEVCSLTFLTSLSTVLEPIYHRDYDYIIATKCGITYTNVKNHASNECRKKTQVNSETDGAIVLPKIPTKTSVNIPDNPFEYIQLKLPLLPAPICHSHVELENDGSLSTIEFTPKNSNVEQKKAKKYHPGTITKHSKKTLLKDFIKNINDFVEIFSSWKNAEKGEFLLNFVDIISFEDMHFLADCIRERLKSFSDFNCLSDKVLLHIFSYLDENNIKAAGQVCKRWKNVILSCLVCKKKSYHLAKTHNKPTVVKFLEFCKADFDWSNVYNQLELSLQQTHVNNIFQTDQQCISSKTFQNAQDVTKIHTVPKTNSIEKYVKNRFTTSIQETSDTIDSSIIKYSIDQENELLNAKLGKKFENSKTDNEITVIGNNIVEEDETAQNKKDGFLNIDVAFDVRPKLIQAANTFILSSEFNGDKEKSKSKIEYAQVPVYGVQPLKRVRKLEGHLDSILCLQFDSKRIITGSADRTVRLWDIRSGRNFCKLIGHQGGVRSVYFDNQYIVTGSWDTTIMIWHVVKFALLFIISEHSGCVSCLEMNEDVLVTGSHDCSLCVFAKHSWSCLTRLKGHEAPVTCLLLLSSEEVLSGSLDGNVIMWKINESRAIRVFKNAGSAILCVKLCGTLLAGGTNHGQVIFWNFNTCTPEGGIQAHKGSVNTLCFTSTRFITGGSDNLIKEWDLGTCACLRSLTGHTNAINCLRASSKRVVSGSADGTVRIWDFVCKLKHTGGLYDEINKLIIHSEIVHEDNDI